MWEETEGVTKNGQYRDDGNAGLTTQIENKQSEKHRKTDEQHRENRV